MRRKPLFYCHLQRGFIPQVEIISELRKFYNIFKFGDQENTKMKNFLGPLKAT